jgi:hypothetical protein
LRRVLTESSPANEVINMKILKKMSFLSDTIYEAVPKYQKAGLAYPEDLHQKFSMLQ